LITLPGSGWLIWYAILIFFGLINAYASVVNPTIAFVVGLSLPISGPALLGPPIYAFFKSIRSLVQRRYRLAIAFGLVPLVGLAVIAASSVIFSSIMTNVKLASYRSMIDAAVANHSNFSEKDVHIDLGPPIVAEFVQPTMFWDAWEIVYVQNDDVSRFEDPDPPCSRAIQPLSRHFYSVRGTC
jgi:hypothetical protein